MSVSLTDELRDFIQEKVKNGQYASEEAVIEAALTQLRDRDESRQIVPTLNDFIDHEFVENCSREANESVTLDEVLQATSAINDSMARVISRDVASFVSSATVFPDR
jgi:putative addiction module CopG family antidote